MPVQLRDLLPLLADIGRSRNARRGLSALSEQTDCSPWYFQRTFRRLIGESPKQYTRRLQLEHAAVMLLTTDLPVLQVAIEVGFESHEGFTRAFTNRFEEPPTAFRQRRATLQNVQRYAELLARVGPCIGLYRTPMKEIPTMKYDITKQTLDETTFLYRSATCAHGEISETLGRLLPGVYQYATTKGLEIVGPPMTLYVKWGPGMTTIHGGMAVKPGAHAEGETELTILPAGQAAVTIHSGPYERLGEAHAALEVFLHEEKLSVAGPLREVYLTDPGEVPNPEDWQTQVIWPFS